MPGTHLIVFAKAPVPGQAKTRLARVIGAQAAAALAARMLDHTLAQAVLADIGSVELCGTPDAAHPLLAAAAERAGVPLTTQGEGELGERMARAFERGLAKHERVLMVGTDCPLLGAGEIREAAQRLAVPLRAVFRPTDDGGYILIGLRRFDPSLFEGIAWSSPEVMPSTRARLRRLAWRWWEGKPLVDIDEAADLAYLPAGWRKAIPAQ
jgi:rSAM/selenodomain-associated transferase 1